MRLPTYISGLCLSLLITISQMSSYKILPTKRCNTLLKARDDYDESNDVIGIQDYFPTSGIETFVSTIASRRPLLPSEYECSFLSFPVLQERYLNKKFPERELEESEDVARYLSWVNTVRGDEDVERVLINFRKTILGKEKYRINNPGKVAEQYCVLLKSCMDVKASWGAAANALEYAGLVIKDHVIERGEDDETGSGGEKPRPVLVVHSLWRSACMQLLDIDIDTPSSPSSPSSSSSSAPSSISSSSSSSISSKNGGTTWDQKFFSQVEMSETSRRAVKDMMLAVVRVAVRCMLSREGVESIDVAIDEFDTPGLGYFPPVSSLKIVLSLDKELKLLEEGECDEEEVDRLNDMLNKVGVVSQIVPSQEAIAAAAAAQESGEIDYKNYTMDRVRTDTYLLFTLCDAKSSLEVQPRRGIFEGYQESEVQDPDSFM